ncbi:MAG: hypothetical protein KF688_17720 [Pirellulales bacterium]|nr:hypothetical protein [Pirellulales bacterium]
MSATYEANRRSMRFGCLVLAAALAGCSGAESEVSGVVTLDGTKVGPGVIVFMPAEGPSNPADGAIRPDGSYFLKTSRELRLRPGKYKVGVSVFDQSPVKPGERSMVPAKYVTPEKFAEPATSGLEYEVAPAKNTINVELVSKWRRPARGRDEWSATVNFADHAESYVDASS